MPFKLDPGALTGKICNLKYHNICSPAGPALICNLRNQALRFSGCKLENNLNLNFKLNM